MHLAEAKRRELEDSVSLMCRRERWDWAGADEDRLRIVARVSGYAPGWVHYRLLEARSATGGARA